MNMWLFILLMCVLLLAIVLVLLWHPQRSRTKMNTTADRQRSYEVYRDDDRYWYGNIFYNNPDDPALFVPKRFGLGWTVNFGNPRGKLVLIGLLLLPLVMVILNILLVGTAPIGCHPSGCHPLP